MTVKKSVLAMALLGLGGIGATAQTYNQYGETGLIDMPTAETLPDGQLGLGYAWFGDTQRGNVSFQLLPRVSGTARIATYRDSLTGPDRSDVGFDLKFQLLEEDGMLPGLALGLRDIFGDGPYGAEYLVATKTVAPGLTLSGGIGFGRLGSAGGFDNPFGLNTRPAVTSPDGQLQDQTWFHGDAAFFGGLSWDTPVEGVTLKAEISSDDYEIEQAGGFDRNSPVNVGVVWTPNDYTQASLNYLYGSTVGVQLNFTGNPMKPLAPQDLGTGPAPLRARAADAPRSTGWADNPENQDKLIAGMAEVLKADGIVLEQALITGTMAEVHVGNTRIPREPKAIGRVARVLALAMPPSVEIFRITLVQNGLAPVTAEIRRSDLEAQVSTPDAGLESWQTTRLIDARARIDDPAAWTRPPGDEQFSWSFTPSIPLELLDRDTGLRPDVLLSARANFQFNRNFGISGELSRFLIGTDQKSGGTQTGPLPRVRSDTDAYYSGQDIKLERLTADLVFQPAPALYGRLSAGALERMFTGVSGEVLLAPVQSTVAVGAELNYVQQREIDAPFALTDYDVVTGHASVYWDTGYKGLEAQLDVGRYLAGDWGATVSLSRRFENGWDLRGYVTRTDVDFADFGEGSYAKGFEVSMPLRWSLPYETKSRATARFVTIEGDGGARLDIEDRLYERIRNLDERSLEDSWSAFWQ